jgi:hypothetical protein
VSYCVCRVFKAEIVALGSVAACDLVNALLREVLNVPSHSSNPFIESLAPFLNAAMRSFSPAAMSGDLMMSTGLYRWLGSFGLMT